MPEICRFLGIIITINYREHGVPHFHVRYNEYQGIFAIETLELLEGSLPKKVISLILEWAFDHKKELLENWRLAESKQSLKKIEPLV
ncbi:MAG: DUF4160 domain-containing protein [Candidatus Electronema sp. V4]|uniref:DUF4160 domain-containing protein n=1 Tax=Candidatus Electronema sp. V4 TaxID=3454756 RepID=UPI004055390E